MKTGILRVAAVSALLLAAATLPAVLIDIQYLVSSNPEYTGRGFVDKAVVSMKPAGSYWSPDELGNPDFGFITLDLAPGQLVAVQVQTFAYKLNAANNALIPSN